MNTKDTMHLSTELRRLRDERGMSQDALAEKSGIHRVTIADIERRDRMNPTLATVCKLATALDVSPAALLPGLGRSRRVKAEAESLDEARLRQLCESAITLAQAGADLPPLPMLRQEAQRLGLRNWALLRDGDGLETRSA